MKITKKLFGQLIIGKIIDHIPIDELFNKENEVEINRAQKIAREIIELAEEQKLFKEDLL